MAGKKKHSHKWNQVKFYTLFFWRPHVPASWCTSFGKICSSPIRLKVPKHVLSPVIMALGFCTITFREHLRRGDIWRTILFYKCSNLITFVHFSNRFCHEFRMRIDEHWSKTIQVHKKFRTIKLSLDFGSCRTASAIRETLEPNSDSRRQLLELIDCISQIDLYNRPRGTHENI